MRIGIDLQVLATQPWTGIAKYTWNLARALRELKTQHEFVFFEPAKKRIPFVTNHLLRARQMQKAGLDVLHGPANVLPFFYPLSISPLSWGRKSFSFLPLPQGRGRGRGGKVKTVITIHDLAIYRHPEWFPRYQWFSTKFLVPRSIKKADAIIVPSEVTKRDVAELFRVPEEKIHVVAHGVEERFFRLQKSEVRSQKSDNRGLTSAVRHPTSDIRVPQSGKYILFVGTLEPRKNAERLIEAYQGLPAEIRREYNLVIVGKPINGRTTGSLPIHRQGVKFLGYVSDQDLGALYQNASIFVYPSLYEGFGLPVLEAMAAGVSVVRSHNVAEVFRPPFADESARYDGNLLPKADSPPAERVSVTVDPHSVQEIREAMVRLIRDTAYASQISRAGRALARQFTWEKTARRTLEVYLA